MLRVSSFGSTLRVYGVAAGGCLIPVGAGVDRFRFRYAFSDSVNRLGRMPCRRADDRPKENPRIIEIPGVYSDAMIDGQAKSNASTD